MINVLLLVDYRNAFYSSTTNSKTLCTMDVEKILGYFQDSNINIEKKQFSEVDYMKDYVSTYVIYQSSEDHDLKYKSYIEDVVLFLKESGAVLLPDFQFLRAHHNKAFMEMLRFKLLPKQAILLDSKIYGTYEELEEANIPEQKYIIKSAYGAGSKFVQYAKSRQNLLRIAKNLSAVYSCTDIIKEIKKRILWKGYVKSSLNRNKFITQNFIEGLSGDYKILKYGKRFYTLYRNNRDNDFRASGGGKLSFELPDSINVNDLLDFAKGVSDKIGTPLCSMDIAHNGKEFILIEFQCLCFGPYTAEHSNQYNVFVDWKWEQVKEKCDLEKVFCEAIIEYINTREN